MYPWSENIILYIKLHNKLLFQYWHSIEDLQ